MITPDISHTHAISKHPVHILDRQGRVSPSAFIPLCEFGGNMSIMGEESPLFDLPICNKFRPKIRNGQLCYQVNVNEVKREIEDKKRHAAWTNISFGL